MSQIYVLSEDADIRAFLEDLFLQSKLSFLSFERIEVMLQAIEHNSHGELKIIWVPSKNIKSLNSELDAFLRKTSPHKVFVFSSVISETDKSVIEKAGVKNIISLPTSIHEILKMVS